MNPKTKAFIGVLLASVGAGLFWEANKQFSIAITVPDNWLKLALLFALGISGIIGGLYLVNQSITTNA
jgi:hypothetical protein